MRRSTVVYILLFLVIAVAYYYISNREDSAAADIAVTPEPDTQPSYLFRVEDGAPTGIYIESKTGEAVEVARDADNAWALTLPTEAAADQGSAEAAASQITVIQVLDHLPELAPQDVGLDDPEYKITIKFTSGVERNVEVGVITPTESGYYARVDGGEIVIVSKDAINSLLELLNNPPYVPTETTLPPTPEAVYP